MSLQLRGSADVIRALRKYGERVMLEAEGEVRERAAAIGDYMRARYQQHYKRGKALASVKVIVKVERARTVLAIVRTGGRGARHAPLLEYGKWNQPPRPYFRTKRALEQHRLYRKLNSIAVRESARFGS